MSTQIIVIGSSTGGAEALRRFLSELPENMPPILIAQHMPATFTKTFAQRLNQTSRLYVKEGEHGELISPGKVYLAPGDYHMQIAQRTPNLYIALNQEPPVNRHRPSVDVLFRSAARHVGRKAMGIMLTGMGKDGASAMLEMKRVGAYNFAQDEATSVVFGMPREAIAMGAVDEVVPLEKMATQVLTRLRSSFNI